MTKLSFNKYVRRHDRFNETDDHFSLTENLNEAFSWPFSRAKNHEEPNKTKQTESDLKNLFAYFKAVNYTKHPKLKAAAMQWLQATKAILDAIQAERAAAASNAKTQVVNPPQKTQMVNPQKTQMRGVPNKPQMSNPTGPNPAIGI